MILSGVTIGDGAVVGSRSVVSRDIAPYAIAAGNPATHISNRFSDEAIAELLRIAWWNWPDDKIEEAFPQLLSEDIEAFIARHRQS